ncbi:MAG TPA: SprT-like domain-containing protein [Polyangiales bacterium]|nr:SprT-like domain-containing protein [Polyangiales bacterium]
MDASPRTTGGRSARPHARGGAVKSKRLRKKVQKPASRMAPTDAYGSAASGLEAALRAQVATPLRLTITDNRRTMISLRRRPPFMELRLHHMFLQADQATRDALADYLFHSDRSAGQAIGRFIERHRERIRRHTPRTRIHLSTAGTHFDLSDIYQTVNRDYFDGDVDAHITWGRDPQLRRVRRSIKLGSYTSRDRLIRVHPALDAAYVPRFFIEYIVYHEMLHHVLLPKVTRGRRDLHGPAFQARERLFLDYARALQWERDNLDRLLRRPGH